ncbi:helix-turn-helix transcriptional regulator [Streptomyces lunaelactis]|uniref:helix-turn-helix transcriptional regulator n=1 Tax=Streptomyces lunaelactis TaxID=1535768 RepID=UPI001585A470|nr:helix-turn-helix transcriptional regulator [Streptomyces lunaelactis]NUK16940.1 helix-turn-helix domain-containing protein [Streptomyces lunaelactis]
MAGRGITDFDPAALVRLRTRARLSQPGLAALARAHGARIGPTHLCLYEQGRRRPQLSTVRALAVALGVEVSALLRASESEDVARLRLAAGLTQRDVAALLGIAASRWSRVERGRVRLEEGLLPTAARVLGTPVSRLRRALKSAGGGLSGRRRAASPAENAVTAVSPAA